MLALFTLVAGCPPSASTGSQTRATISGRVVLVDKPGLNDMSRVRVDLGRGEGGVAPDEQGNFEFSDVEPDVYTLVVTFSGGLTLDATGSAYRRHETRVVARAGGSVVLGELRPALGDGAVHGTITHVDGTPGDGTNVDLVLDDGGVLSTTAVGGQYSFSKVPVGRHRVAARQDGYAVSSQGVGVAAVIDRCGAGVTVGVGDEDAPAPTMGLVRAEASFLPGADQTFSVEGNTWYLNTDSPTVRVVSGYAVTASTWLNDDEPPLPSAFNADGYVVQGLPAGVTEWHVELSDGCGYTSRPYTVRLVRDVEAPLLDLVQLNHGATITASPSAVATLLATDVLSPELEMRWVLCSVDASGTESCALDLDEQTFTSLQREFPVNLDADGRLRLKVEVRDASGNVATGSAEIVLDTEPPADVTVTIAGGADEVRQPTVMVSIRATGATLMQVGTASGLAGVPWEPFAAERQMTLGGGDGEKKVFLRLRDDAGNSSDEVYDTIILDTTGPLAGTLSLANGAEHVQDPDVAFRVTGGAEGDFVVLYGDLSAGVLGPFAWGSVPARLDLEPGEGPKLVWAILRDPAGNESAAFFDSVTVDATAPLDPEVTINSGAELTRSVSVVVEVRRDEESSPLDAMRVACDDNIAAAPRVPFTTFTTCLLPPGDGEKLVAVQLEDAAGNASAVRRVAITLDQTAPTLPVLQELNPVLAPEGPEYNVEITLAAPSTDDHFDHHEAIGANLLEWTVFDGTTLTVQLLDEGSAVVRVRGVDSAGNVSAESAVTLTRDTTAPTAPCVETGCGVASPRFINEPSYTVQLAHNGSDEHLAGYDTCVLSATRALDCASNCNEAALNPGPITSSFAVALTSNASNVFCVRSRDAAGNTSAWDSLELVHDDQPPPAPILADPPGVVTGPTVDLFFLATSAVLDLSHYEVLGGAWMDAESYCKTAQPPFCIPPRNLGSFLVDEQGLEVALRIPILRDRVNTISVRAVDKAGNRSAAAQVEVREGSGRLIGTSPDFVFDVQLSGELVTYAADPTGALVRDPGQDLRSGTSDDIEIVLSGTLLGPGSPDRSRRLALAPGMVARVDTAYDVPGVVDGTVVLRTTGDNGYFDDLDDIDVRVTPLPGACGSQLAFRNPSISNGRILVGCSATSTNRDVVLVTPGPNGVFEDTAAPGRDDVVIPIAATAAVETSGVLSHETAAFLMQNGAAWDLQVRLPGPDGILGSGGDDTTATLDTDVVEMPPALVMPTDPGIPSCQKGVAYLKGGRLMLRNVGSDGVLASSDDETIVLRDFGFTVLYGPLRVDMSPGLVFARPYISDEDVVIAAGPDGCFQAHDVLGRDDEITVLRTGSNVDVALGRNAWLQVRRDDNSGNALVLHDTLVRRPLYWKVPTDQVEFGLARGDGFAVLPSSSTILVDRDNVVHRRYDPSLYARWFVGGRRKFASLAEGADRLSVTEAGSDGRFFTADDVVTVVAQDGPGVDVLGPAPHGVALSDDALAWIDTSQGVDYYDRDVMLRYAGTNGIFEGDTDATECTVALTSDDAFREYLTLSGPNAAWERLPNTVQVHESGADRCAVGTITTLPMAGRLKRPFLLGNQVVAVETNGLGYPVGVVALRARGTFANGVDVVPSCRIPPGWSLFAGGGNSLVVDALLDDAMVLILARGAERRTVACHLADGVLRSLDQDLPLPENLASYGSGLLIQTPTTGGVMEVSTR
ncbi:MAG: hypothetical protein AB2A00_29305 [Myxococcota bacterium]